MHSLLRRILLMPVTTEGARIIDLVILPIGAVVAFFVCIPIWIVAALVGGVIGAGLHELGVPEGISSLVGLAGIVGGLVLSFVVLVRLYRRMPARIRAWVVSDGDDAKTDTGPVQFRRDPDADAATLRDRLAAADATLVADDPPPADR